ncbi:MAG: cysteine hydrolase [Deltaproteobacteria bacterium]|nr:cysteine hydrolase [Deltaproteobacteria bacterium]
MKDKTALLIIDMVKDNLDENNNFPITTFAKKIIPSINRLIKEVRKSNGLIVFPTDSYTEKDFIFKGKMKPHSIRGTKGAEVTELLDMEKEDLWLPKPKFSAFFGTNLNQWLKERGVTRCAIAGIAAHFCVLTTAMDAICYDFKTIILKDCTAAFSESIHEKTIEIFTKNPLYPLFKIASADELIQEL